MPPFDTGEARLLEAAEAQQKEEIAVAKTSLAEQLKDFVAEHPVTTVGIASAATALVVVTAGNPRRTRMLKVPVRMAIATLFGITR